MRAIWKGAVSFGLVSIAVKLYSATEEKDIRFQPRWLEMLRSAREVWDYSLMNIEFLRAAGVTHVKHLPIGYHAGLRTIPKLPEEPIDVLFYGSKTDRRAALVMELTKHCTFKLLWRVYGKERDEFIARWLHVLSGVT